MKLSEINFKQKDITEKSLNLPKDIFNDYRTEKFAMSSNSLSLLAQAMYMIHTDVDVYTIPGQTKKIEKWDVVIDYVNSATDYGYHVNTYFINEKTTDEMNPVARWMLKNKLGGIMSLSACLTILGTSSILEKIDPKLDTVFLTVFTVIEQNALNSWINGKNTTTFAARIYSASF
jgi:hypothetical protein